MIFITKFFLKMMPKNPHNMVANTNASNTGIACRIRVGRILELGYFAFLAMLRPGQAIADQFYE
jgi:hypothetical protein